MCGSVKEVVAANMIDHRGIGKAGWGRIRGSYSKCIKKLYMVKGCTPKNGWIMPSSLALMVELILR